MSKSFKILSVAGAFLLAAPLAFAGIANASSSDRALNDGDHEVAPKVGCHHEQEKHAFFHHAFAHGFPMNPHGCYYGSPFPFSLGSKVEVKGGHFLECVASKDAPISFENPLHWEAVKGFMAK
ncbi:hypothetical protein FAI41_00775 [Acetobacteraceae bacterium]|nr:hypothetical protein FAI41_00775 [Acetobacteraceae bacterium]